MNGDYDEDTVTQLFGRSVVSFKN